MGRDFWILMNRGDETRSGGTLSGQDTPTGAGGRPYLEMSRSHAYEPVLPVFSSEEGAAALSRHVGEQHAREVPVATKLTQGQIRERVFGGDYRGRCVVDSAPDRVGREVAVSDPPSA